MTLLNDADAIFVGADAADKVYLGANLVWPLEPAIIYPEATAAAAFITELNDGGEEYYLASFLNTGTSAFVVSVGGEFECQAFGGGGGGGFGSATICGGGGGGGAPNPLTLDWRKTIRVPGSYNMTVAAGGTRSTTTGSKGGQGGNSFMWNADSVFNAVGGGGGGSATNTVGSSAACGGGGAGATLGTGGVGNPGKDGGSFDTGTKGCGGGGMATAGGQGSGTGTTAVGGVGGEGIPFTMGGVTTYFCAGGGGGGGATGLGGAGGSGVGGAGAGGGLVGSQAVPNSGSGGGGGGPSLLGSVGASGRVLIRWKRGVTYAPEIYVTSGVRGQCWIAHSARFKIDGVVMDGPEDVPVGTTVALQWLYNGAELVGETGWSYTPDGSFHENFLSYKLTITKGGGSPFTIWSDRLFMDNPNLLINGDFSAGNTGWNTPSASWSIGSGRANYVNSNQDLDQAFAFVAGRQYEVRFSIVAYTSGSVIARFSGGTLVSGTARSALGMYSQILTAATGNNLFKLRNATANGIGSVDNLSLRRMT